MANGNQLIGRYLSKLSESYLKPKLKHGHQVDLPRQSKLPRNQGKPWFGMVLASVWLPSWGVLEIYWTG